jgi:hypothetical protein
MRLLTAIAPTLAVSVLLLMVFGAGCNKPPYDLAPVHGKVTFNGKPLTNAKVMFAPIAKGESRKSGKPAFGVLQSDGAFVLGTYEPDDGAVVGEHWVTVFKMNNMAATSSQTPGQSHRASEPSGSWARAVFPEPKAVVANQDNEINIELTSEIIARHGAAEE